MAVRLHGPLDVPAFAAALRDLDRKEREIVRLRFGLETLLHFTATEPDAARTLIVTERVRDLLGPAAQKCVSRWCFARSRSAGSTTPTWPLGCWPWWINL